MRWGGTLLAVLALAGAASAGELVLRNGTSVAAELVNEALLLSTGADVIEVTPEQIGTLTPEEVRLKDGRVLRGTLVGGHLKARTPLGELAISIDELRVFRADSAAAPEAPAAAIPAPAPAPAAADAPRGPNQVAEGAKKIGQGVEDAAKGVGRTVTDGADRLHDGAKAFGVAIWEGMKSVGRAIRSAFPGS